jgi:hypothetical protein
MIILIIIIWIIFSALFVLGLCKAAGKDNFMHWS